MWNLVCRRAENEESSWFIQSLIFCARYYIYIYGCGYSSGKRNIVTALIKLDHYGGKRDQAINNDTTKYIIADYYEFHKGHGSFGWV